MEQKPKYVARIDNVYFLTHLGSSLRKAAGQIATEELPEDIQALASCRAITSHSV